MKALYALTGSLAGALVTVLSLWLLGYDWLPLRRGPAVFAVFGFGAVGFCLGMASYWSRRAAGELRP